MCIFRPTTISACIRGGTSRCASTISRRCATACAQAGARFEEADTDPGLAPLLCVRSVRQQDRARRDTGVSEFRFSPRPNRASEIKWRTWGDAAFAEAREQGKPVLLAISAVWCHWCHVMDETSYSIPEIIEIINDRYVPVRVDNDERPDVNRRYNMGGWPTTVFLTPEGEIIHGGTYVPPDQMWQAVNGVNEVWTTKREEITARVAELHEQEAKAAQARAGRRTGEEERALGGHRRHDRRARSRAVRPAVRRLRPLAEVPAGPTPSLPARTSTAVTAIRTSRTCCTRRSSAMAGERHARQDRGRLLPLRDDPRVGDPALREDARGQRRAARGVRRGAPHVPAGGLRPRRARRRPLDGHGPVAGRREGVRRVAGRRRGLLRARRGGPREARRAVRRQDAVHRLERARGVRVRRGGRGARRRGDRGTRARGRWARSPRGWSSGRIGTLMHFDRGEGPRVADLLSDWAAYLQATIDEYETGQASRRARRRREGGDGHARAARGSRRTAGSSMRRSARSRDESALREKPIEDNAMAADALLRLAALTGDERWRETALRTLRAFVGSYRGWGQFASSYANAMARALAEPLTIAVVGPKDDADGDGAVDRGALRRRSGPEHPADRPRRRRRASSSSSASRRIAPRRTCASARPAPPR